MTDVANADWRKAGWLHVYAQPVQHEDARIRGTAPALAGLRDAIEAARSAGVGEAVAFAADGEGYAVKVQRIEVIGLLGPLPYTEENWNAARHAAWSVGPHPGPGSDRIRDALAGAFAAGVRHAAERRGEAPPVPDDAYRSAEAVVSGALDDLREALAPIQLAVHAITGAGEVPVPAETCRAIAAALDVSDG